MKWRHISVRAVQISALAVLSLGTWFAVRTPEYPFPLVLLVGIGWLAGLVGLVEERRGAWRLAAAAFLTVAVVVPNFFAEGINLLLVGTIVSYVLASRGAHTPKSANA